VAWPRLWAAMFSPIADAPLRNTGQECIDGPDDNRGPGVQVCSGLFNFPAAPKKVESHSK
ncbi:MAG: hypothetical protein V3T70_10640, partial [Phycisphaerae bacterium]